MAERERERDQSGRFVATRGATDTAGPGWPRAARLSLSLCYTGPASAGVVGAAMVAGPSKGQASVVGGQLIESAMLAMGFPLPPGQALFQ